MAILTNQTQVAEASLADLLETYNALTGQSVKRFATREVGARRTENAMLAAKDADGHTGVPKGAEPQARTREEIVAKAAAKGLPTPPALGEEPPVTFPEGTLGASLSATAETAAPIEPRARKAAKTSSTPKKNAFFAASVTGKGTTKLQANSVRKSVYDALAGEKFKGLASIEELRKHLDLDPRGHLQKLALFTHVEMLDEAEFTRRRAEVKT